MKIIKKLLLILLLVVILSASAFADNPNIGQGDVVDLGSGTGANQWRTSWEGVRVTVVDKTGTQYGISYDWLNFKPESRVFYFGNVSKLKYTASPSLSVKTKKYIYVTDLNLPRIIPETNESTLEELREYFTQPYIIDKMLKYTLTEGKVDLSSGNYKIVIEPLVQIKYDGLYYIMTSTEIALFEKRMSESEKKPQSSFFYNFYSLTHINLPMAIILEESDFGYPVFTTNMTTRAAGYKRAFLSNETITDVGVGIGIIPLQFKITASCNEGGKITPSGTKTYGYGSSATYIIKPNNKYIIKDVLVDEKSAGPVTEYEFEDISNSQTWRKSTVQISVNEPEDFCDPLAFIFSGALRRVVCERGSLVPRVSGTIFWGIERGSSSKSRTA